MSALIITNLSSCNVVGVSAKPDGVVHIKVPDSNGVMHDVYVAQSMFRQQASLAKPVITKSIHKTMMKVVINGSKDSFLKIADANPHNL